MGRGWLPGAAAELAATSVLVFLVTGSLVVDEHLGADGYGLLGVALVTGTAYALAVAIARPVGGGHANPAVTVAAYLSGRLPLVRAGAYVIAQSLGGLLGAAFTRALLPQTAAADALYGAAQVDAGATLLAAVTLELVVTFALALAAFAVLFDDELAGGALAVGAAALAGTAVAFPVTGAAMNPARALGPALLEGVWRGQWIYLVGPVLGATLAGAVHDGLIRDVDDAPEASEEA